MNSDSHRRSSSAISVLLDNPCREAFGRILGMTGSQFAVLVGTAYRQRNSGAAIKDLADHISLAPTHVTTEVGRLIRRGLLIKRPSPSDRRSVLVRLSAQGEQAVARVTPFVRRLNDLLFADISPKDLEIVAKVNLQLIANSEYAMAEIRRNSITNRAGL